MRLACLLFAVAVVSAGICAQPAMASGSGIPPTSDPGAISYCTNRAAMGSQTQTVEGVKVVAVCVDNYQFVPGDDNVGPCLGYIGGTPASSCVSGPRVAAPKLEIKRGTRLLFVVPDPNMHTLTSTNCPNVFVDPPSPDPVGAFNLAIGTAEAALFGPDDITQGHGRCWFDTYKENGGTVPPRAGKGDLVGPGYETVDTTRLPAGTYHFYCQVHAFMQGTLVVDKR
jgi:plastocyanin